MTVRLGLPLFLLYSLIPFTVLRTPPPPWRTEHPLSYLLHALPSLSLYYIHAHQYLLMRTLCAPFGPVFPPRYLMYHRTRCVRFPTP